MIERWQENKHMQLKDYQQRAMDIIKRYLETLDSWREKNNTVISTIGADAAIDFPAKTWTELGLKRDYFSKKDGLGNYFPNFCLKIPTGGGKTFMAVKTIDLVNQLYLKKQNGLVLWVVPTTQIYNQTLRSLKDKAHPYRQSLDIASGNKTLILEKMDHFSPADLEENLAILLLMLPSAARQTKETLKIFRDNGFTEFFPAEDDIEGHAKLLEKIPNLDYFGEKDGFWGRQIKTSLGNTLRVLKPMMILDEGQKAYSKLAQETLKGFNPSIIVELSATPPEGSSILVDVTGTELNDEEMIKLDLHIYNKKDANWKNTLLESVNHRQFLEKKALDYEANTGNYIRPICLIQVERTGKDQRGSGFIHSEEVKECLIKEHGVAPEEIAIKTSEKDELKEIDDVGGLVSKGCNVRYIITKQALQEGWDCAFAYILTILTNPSSQGALTQLVGRILRQPKAKKIRVYPELDESYVFCFQQKAGELLDKINRGFRGEGLGDLTGRISTEEGFNGDTVEEKTFGVRESFQEIAKRVVLPVFAIRKKDKWNRVDYDNDIASRIDWKQIDVSPLFSLTLSKNNDKDKEYITSLTDDMSKPAASKEVRNLRNGGIELDPVYMTRQLLDVVPNPWEAHEIGKAVLEKLIEKNGEDLVFDNFVYIIEEIKKYLQKNKDEHAKNVFDDLINKGEVRFLMIGRDLGYHLPEKIKVKGNENLLSHGFNRLVQKSLFEHVPETNINGLEKNVALFLDDQEKLLFWYRNESKRDYSLQGWQKNKVYPDFLFTTSLDQKKIEKVFVAETKGEQLLGNEDTKYKESLFELCNTLAKEKDFNEMGLAFENQQLEYMLVDEKEWKEELGKLFV